MMHKTRKLLANNIVYFRHQKHWTQEELAEKMGPSPAYISQLENAKRNVTSDFIDKLSDSFEIEIRDLFIKRDYIKNIRI